MELSVKMMGEVVAQAQQMAENAKGVAQATQGMAEATQAMAEAMQRIVDNCAKQLAEKRAAEGVERTDKVQAPSQKAPAKQTGKVQVPTEPPKAPTPVNEPTLPDEPALPDDPAAIKQWTVETLREFAAKRSTPENRPKIRKILQGYGVQKLTDLSPDHYQSFVSELEAL